MLCDEGCRTAVFGKTERTVGWEGNGEPIMTGLLRHCDEGNLQSTDRPALPSLSHSFTLDIVVGFEHEADARRFWDAMRTRFERFALALHGEKTRLLEFGRHAAARRLRRGIGRPETFVFLGFTFICGKTRRGAFQLQRKTQGKRMKAKLREIKVQLRRRMHASIPEQGRWLQAVVRGYFAYHAVPTNAKALGAFRHHVTNLWRRTLRRRSQKDAMTFSRMTRIADAWLPPPRILHPWPDRRFAVKHPR